MNEASQRLRTIQACAQMPAFRGLDDGQCRQLLNIASERAFAPGEVVIEQGGHSEQLWILLEGKCEVVKDSQHDGPLVLAQLEPHNVFGEMSFFSPAPHSASVVAKTQVRLLSIARRDYDELLCAGNLAAYKLAYNVVQSLATRLRRMDDWVTDLMLHQKETATQAEWSDFREKLFSGWNA